jgi:hypothetical protein
MNNQEIIELGQIYTRLTGQKDPISNISPYKSRTV